MAASAFPDIAGPGAVLPSGVGVAQPRGWGLFILPYFSLPSSSSSALRPSCSAEVLGCGSAGPYLWVVGGGFPRLPGGRGAGLALAGALLGRVKIGLLLCP